MKLLNLFQVNIQKHLELGYGCRLSQLIWSQDGFTYKRSDVIVNKSMVSRSEILSWEQVYRKNSAYTISMTTISITSIK
jgi:hypothetical protein